MRVTALLLSLGLLAVTACSTAPAPVAEPVPESADPSPSATGSASAPESADPSANAVTTCYFGPSTQTAADGTERPGADLLVRRTVDREAGTITEETARFDTQSGVSPRRYTIVYTVDDDAFELTEAGGAFAGSGTFTAGEPWAWTAWESSYRLTSGIAVESTRGLTTGDDGRAILSAERVAFGPDGGRALTLDEQLEAISDDECERRFAELPPAD